MTKTSVSRVQLCQLLADSLRTDATTLVIYGISSPKITEDDARPPKMNFHAGRYVPPPPAFQPALPRPDDPAPRRAPSVPLDLLAKSSRSRTSAKRETVMASASGRRLSVDGPSSGAARSRSRDSSMARTEEEDESMDLDQGDPFSGGGTNGKRGMSAEVKIETRGSSVLGDEDVFMAEPESLGSSSSLPVIPTASSGGRRKASPLEASNKDVRCVSHSSWSLLTC